MRKNLSAYLVATDFEALSFMSLKQNCYQKQRISADDNFLNVIPNFNDRTERALTFFFFLTGQVMVIILYALLC